MATLEEIVDAIDKKLYDLSLLISDPGSGIGGTNTFPDNIVIGTPGVSLDLVSSAPTGLVATPGTFFDNSYADIQWTPNADASTIAYDVEWARRSGAPGAYTYSIVDVTRTHGNSVRLNNLIPGQFYGVRVTGFNRIGWPSASLPAAGFTDFQAGVDATLPAGPTGLTIFAGLRSLIVRWTDNAEADVVLGQGTYRVQVSSNAGFTAIVKDTTVSGIMATFADLNAVTQYWVRIFAIDSSGNQSAPSGSVTAVTGQATGNDIAANVIVSNHIATFGLDAGVIKFGTLDGNLATIAHVKAGNIDTSSLTSASITLAGGSLQAGSPPSTGLLINSQGIRLYSGGSAVVTLDVSGVATFTGTITSSTINSPTISGGSISATTFSTASSGGRLVMGPAAFGGLGLQFQSGLADQTAAGQILLGTDFLNRPYVMLSAPQRSSLQTASINMYSQGTGGFGDGEIDYIAHSHFFTTAGGLWRATGSGEYDMQDGFLRVAAPPSGGAFNSTVQLQAQSAGNAGLGFLPYSTSGDFTMDDSTGNIYANPSLTIVAFHVDPSKRSYKADIKELGSAYSLETIKKLKPKHYTYNGTPDDKRAMDEHKKQTGKPYPRHPNIGRKHIGFIAEDVFEHVPEIVALDGDRKPAGIEYTKLGVLSILGIQELIKRVEALEAKES